MVSTTASSVSVKPACSLRHGSITAMRSLKLRLIMSAGSDCEDEVAIVVGALEPVGHGDRRARFPARLRPAIAIRPR